MTTIMKATPAKLRDGSWGAKVHGTCKVGDTVTIETRAGKTWDATVTSVVWSSPDESEHLVRTRGLDRDASPRRSRRSHRSSRAIEVRIGGKSYYRNASGERCEDAPCCGCCTI